MSFTYSPRINIEETHIINYHYAPTHVEPVSRLMVSAVKLISAESGVSGHHLRRVIIIVKLRVLNSEGTLR